MLQQRIKLLRSSDQYIVEALLVEMTQRHFEDFNLLWRDLLREFVQEDKLWDWLFKLSQSLIEKRYESYAIELDGITQGLIWLETEWHRSWLNPEQNLVYVSAIASAPWNRRYIQNPPFLQGVGTALLLLARQRSLDLGYGGRVGLHALPGAEGFYRRKGMPEYGKDPELEELNYFEYGSIRQR